MPATVSTRPVARRPPLNSPLARFQYTVCSCFWYGVIANTNETAVPTMTGGQDHQAGNGRHAMPPLIPPRGESGGAG
ncbi:MAG: hypothetical protein KJ069_32110 [Anaerolineae bacterium]|nr:hypothetical protein [Anaerolineae bacterium]